MNFEKLAGEIITTFYKMNENGKQLHEVIPALAEMLASRLDAQVMPKIAEIEREIETAMNGKIIKGILNGQVISEQWINVNNAIMIAKYFARKASNFSA